MNVTVFGATGGRAWPSGRHHARLRGAACARAGRRRGLRAYATRLGDYHLLALNIPREAYLGYFEVLDGRPGIARIRRAFENARGKDHAPGLRATLARIRVGARAIAGDRSGLDVPLPSGLFEGTVRRPVNAERAATRRACAALTAIIAVNAARDVTAVAAVALTGDGHAGRTYRVKSRPQLDVESSTSTDWAARRSIKPASAVIACRCPTPVVGISRRSTTPGSERARSGH